MEERGGLVPGSDRSPLMTADVRTDPDGAVSTFSQEDDSVRAIQQSLHKELLHTTLPPAYQAL